MIHEELQRLEGLAAHAVNKIRQAERENEALREELAQMENLVREKDEAIEHFKNQIKISKIVHNIPAGGKASAELREKINNYIKEIDKIVAYLSE